MEGSVWERRPFRRSQVCRSPTAPARRSSSDRHCCGGAIGPHDELGEPDLEEPLHHVAQAAEPDRDDLLERPPAGPAGQRRRGQGGEVGALGGVGEADAEVLRTDGPPVLGRHPVDHRLARCGVGRRAEGRDPPVGQAPAALERRRDVAAEPDVEGVLDRSRRDRDVGERAGRPLVGDLLAAHSRRSTGSASSISAPRSAVGIPMALRSPPRARPGTKVRRKRPPESTSSVATALASHTRLRPGRSMVVPILSPGQAPDTQASPTSGSGPGRVSTSGSHSESKPVSEMARRQRDHGVGPEALAAGADPDADLHPALPGASPSAADGARDAGVVDVVVRDEADGPGRDGVRQHPRRSRWASSLSGSGWVKVTMFVRTRAGSRPHPGQRSRHGVGQPRRPGMVLGQALDHLGQGHQPRRGEHAGLAHAATEALAGQTGPRRSRPPRRRATTPPARTDPSTGST